MERYALFHFQVKLSRTDVRCATTIVYLIFLFWDALEVVVIYIFLVETKGLTLEEINDVFDRPNPRKYSQQLLRESGGDGGRVQ